MRHCRLSGYSASCSVKHLRQTEGWIVSHVRKKWHKELEDIADKQGKGGGQQDRSAESRRIVLRHSGEDTASVTNVCSTVLEERGKTIARSTVSRIFVGQGIMALKYRFDLHVSKIFKFLFLFTRLTLLMTFCFFLLKDHGGKLEDILIEDKLSQNKELNLFLALVFGSFFFIPLPSFLYQMCYNKYKL